MIFIAFSIELSNLTLISGVYLISTSSATLFLKNPFISFKASKISSLSYCFSSLFKGGKILKYVSANFKSSLKSTYVNETKPLILGFFTSSRMTLDITLIISFPMPSSLCFFKIITSLYFSVLFTSTISNASTTSPSFISLKFSTPSPHS